MVNLDGIVLSKYNLEQLHKEEEETIEVDIFFCLLK
jgi:hypothetical protein